MMATKHALNKVFEFGDRLIRTEDLDPVYVCIYKAGLPVDQVKRLLLAYWCFYHLGAAARLSEMEGSDYWDLVEVAAENILPPNTDDLPGDRWPRGTERRHFRGKKCVEAVRWLSRYGTPETIVTNVMLQKTLDGVCGEVQKWPLFGPWIAFKAADMVERLLGANISFPEDFVLWYKEPRAGLDRIDLEPAVALSRLRPHYMQFKAPPGYDRCCSVQEIETVLCKWKSSLGGHYWVGKDIHEVRVGLKGWGATADQLLAAAPQEVPDANCQHRGLFA